MGTLYNRQKHRETCIMKLNEINLRDPYILTENGVCYLYGTTGGSSSWSGKAQGFDVYVSEDGENFIKKPVFRPNPSFWSDENYWAPEVHKIGGKFFMFASFFRKGEHRKSHILVCDTPDGTFVPLPAPLTPENWDCLDATYFEEDGKKYTIFCHEWTQCKDGEMVLAELDENLSIKGQVRVLFRASQAPWTRGFDGGNFITDGPFLHRMKSGKLMMLFSSSGEHGYAMGMATADCIEGPWTHCKDPLISQDGGHGMLFQKDGKLFVTYHMPNHPSGAERPYFAEVIEEGDRLVLAK